MNEETTKKWLAMCIDRKDWDKAEIAAMELSNPGKTQAMDDLCRVYVEQGLLFKAIKIKKILGSQSLSDAELETIWRANIEAHDYVTSREALKLLPTAKQTALEATILQHHR
ncbi:MAG: hypothetical protein PHN74_03070 [Candidatus Pacebacteria bacterium]|nr:hypothetical protein [Candidatus Paceibacterota bacterium]